MVIPLASHRIVCREKAWQEEVGRAVLSGLNCFGNQVACSPATSRAAIKFYCVPVRENQAVANSGADEVNSRTLDLSSVRSEDLTK